MLRNFGNVHLIRFAPPTEAPKAIGPGIPDDIRLLLRESLGRTFCAIIVSPSGLWVEPEDAQLLVTTTGLRDARGPRDGLLA